MNRVAVDIGGTFVDGVTFDSDKDVLTIKKSDTTPHELNAGVVEVIDRLDVELSTTATFIHGTTLGLNALLEREGARTGIITNRGFRDVFELGRYDRPHAEMVNPAYTKPESLVPRPLRQEIDGRLDYQGTVIQALDDGTVDEAAGRLIDEAEVESVAVCLLHSYTNDVHEQEVRQRVEDQYPGVSVSLSSEITREFREYERTSTTVLNAYIKPIFESYIDRLETIIKDNGFGGSFLVTRSGGGALTEARAKETPIHSILSGPAGGIIGAAHIGQLTGRGNLIAADVGGTSLDTCVITDGEPVIKHESTIENHPLLIPVYDIRTIGAGGGSIARLDGDLLKVGPTSAGAEPGPICYGKGGTDPTVTDAAVLLGYIRSEAFLGGEMSLEVDRAEEIVESDLADPLETTIESVCQGIFHVTANNIISSIREITVERGLDPRDFDILAYGGAGPMIMPFVAREMGVREVIIPQAPSVFSAWGLLLSDIIHDYSKTSQTTLDATSLEEVNRQFASLEDTAKAELEEEKFASADQQFERSCEMRYVGQEHTVQVRADGLSSLEDLATRFRDQYQDRYGHGMDDLEEIVHFRLRAIGQTEKPTITDIGTVTSKGYQDPDESHCQAYCFAMGTVTEFDVIPRSSMDVGVVREGPLIVQEPTTTMVIFSDQTVQLDEYGQLRIVGTTA